MEWEGRNMMVCWCAVVRRIVVFVCWLCSVGAEILNPQKGPKRPSNPNFLRSEFYQAQATNARF